MSSRRDFLKQSVLTTAAAFAAMNPATAAFATSLAKKPKVIVIGAGFSGLSAAYLLKQKGYEVTVLEARERISGRVHSYTIDEKEKLVVELGAEWVGASHERLIALCKEFGLELDNNQFTSRLTYKGEYFDKDKWSYSEEWKKKFEYLTKDYYKKLTDKDKKRLDKMDWWRFLISQGISDRDLDIRELADSTDFGESTRFVSAYAAFAEYAESSPNNEMDYKIKGGNGMLAQKLAEKIGMENIKLKSKVTSITQSGRRVTLMVEQNGNLYQKMECDFVICSIPTFAMTKIAWSPALPPEKMEAINELQYARINKCITLFDQKVWKAEDFDMVTDSYGHYFYNATKNQPSQKGALTAYICGDKADVIGRQNEQFRRDVISYSLTPAFGDVSKLMSKQVNYYWGSDPFSKGSYAIYGKGQWFSVMPVLKKKFQNVYFAGEHLADWQGFMEGAINTGEEAAQGIIG